MIGYVGSWRKRVAAVEEDFQRMIFQSSKLLLLYDFNRFIPTSYGQPFLYWSKLQRFPCMGGASSFRGLVQFERNFVFQSFVQCDFSRQSVALSGESVPLERFSQILCLAMLIPVKKYPRQSVTIRGELVPLELFDIQALPSLNYFLNVYSRFLKQKKQIDSSLYGWYFPLCFIFLFMVFPYMV